MDILNILQTEFKLKTSQVENTLKLIDEGCTIPFIARYRKEQTGSLDDQVLRELHERLTYLRGLEKRKEEVCTSITSQEKMTSEIQLAIDNAKTLTELEDIYRPFKQKRKTRASQAKERGLEPLSELIFQQSKHTDVEKEAENYINDEVSTVADAINGALDIIAEMISDDANIRKSLRVYFNNNGIISTKATNPDADSVYSMYYEYKEPVSKIVGHRVLAIDRGEKEGILKVDVNAEIGGALYYLKKKYVKEQNKCGELVALACEDSYTRLIYPSIEREIRSNLSDEASQQAIKVFAVNLKMLLMQPPIKGVVTLAVDPAYRTGCKIAVVDATGKVLDTTVVYPTPPQNKVDEAKAKLKALIKKHGVTVIAIGNGTASRESEAFVAEMIKEIEQKVSYVVVSEAGASVYSASKLASEEFPEYDVSLRSAVSIARRLQDPLAELVKIDPKAIGVGQYQHDMPKAKMDEALGGVVEDCVNNVGVDLNTASHSLLARVSGINASVAKNIVAYREENGEFTDRKQLMKVPKLGAKAFTQSAGFLRISDGKNILDNTGVHPESYKAIKELIKLCGYTLEDVSTGKIGDLKQKVEKMGINNLATEIGVGDITLSDAIDELLKPGRDPRDEMPKPILRSDVLEMKDLKPGMELKGTVRNVIDFGAFVDIGVHEDGLVHISRICDKFIKHPLEVVSVGDIVTVWVLDIDMKKKRISLSMKPIK